MDGLPPTVRVFSLHNSAIAHDWTVAKLPRQMRFLLLSNSCVGSSAHRRGSTDFHNLPSQMEELYFRRVLTKGVIYIGNLPESMRIVEIGSRIIRTAVVAFEALPANLVSMNIAGFNEHKATVKIVGVGRVRKDERVSNTYMTKERAMAMTNFEDMFPFRI